MYKQLKSYFIYSQRIGLRKTLVKLNNILLGRVKYQPLEDFDKVKIFFENKKGIEVGGPSPFFGEFGFLPIYPIAKSIDGVNFSSSTVWTGGIDTKNGFMINGKRFGNQYIADGANLTEIVKKDSYDFVLSCNNLEHIANPLKAIEGWIALLKKGGVLVLVLPRKESNFDNKRSIVDFKHLLEDYNRNTKEDDLTHLEEILNKHDFELDPFGGTPEEFKQRAQDNINNRCLHHHVFELKVLKEICKHFKLRIVKEARIETDYVIIAQKDN